MLSCLGINCKVKCKLYEGWPLKYIFKVGKFGKLLPLNMEQVLTSDECKLPKDETTPQYDRYTVFSLCVCFLGYVLCSKLCDSCSFKEKRLLF